MFDASRSFSFSNNPVQIKNCRQLGSSEDLFSCIFEVSVYYQPTKKGFVLKFTRPDFREQFQTLREKWSTLFSRCIKLTQYNFWRDPEAN